MGTSPVTETKKKAPFTFTPARSMNPERRFDTPHQAEPALSREQGSPELGHSLGRVSVLPEVGTKSLSCPLRSTPSRCPFGGACHTCPTHLQRKLAVGEPDDEYEQEADRVAAQVMRMPAPPTLEPSSSVDMGTALIEASPIVHEVLQSPGQPLEPRARDLMESRLEHDFSDVRVHTDAKAVESARTVNALAYTVGGDIVLGAGRAVGDGWLLAHELVHVVQQGAGASPYDRRIQRICARSADEVGYPVNVNLTVPPTPPPDHSQNTAWISGQARDPTGQTTGLTVYEIYLDFTGIHVKFDAVSSWVHSIDIRARNASIRIYIASEVPAQSCEYRDLLRHEQQHDRDYRRNVSAAEARICQVAAGWPTKRWPLALSVLTSRDLVTEITDSVKFHQWLLEYDNWLDTCTWDEVDYPGLYKQCPGTQWSAPLPKCPEPPSKPTPTVFQLPRRDGGGQ